MVGDQVPHAGDAQVEGLQQQQRKECPRLVAVERAGDGSAGLDLSGGERQRAGADVRILVRVGRVGVMTVVLVHQPAVAEAYAEVREQGTETAVRPRGREDLSVPG